MINFQREHILEFLGVTDEEWDGLYSTVNTVLYFLGAHGSLWNTKEQVQSYFDDSEKEEVSKILDAFSDVQLFHRCYFPNENDEYIPKYSLYTEKELREIHGYVKDSGSAASSAQKQ